jgi:DNA-binding CsgD family transcriptional regulator
VELLAVCERFGLADLEQAHGSATLEALEASGLVAVMSSGRRSAVRLAHPLYGEVLRERLLPLRLRRIHQELADLSARDAGSWRRGRARRRRRVGPGLARGTSVEPLTPREREVALLAAGGHSSRDIGERLSLSTRTVDTHLARVYRKLGITGRGELASALGTPRAT